MVAGFVLWHERAAPDGAPPPPAPVPVTVAPVRDSAELHDLIGIGKVQAFNTVDVIPQVSGQIVKVAFQEGQMVHAGDLLVQIDPRPFQAKLDQDTATLAKDTALFSNAALDLKRFRGLAVSNAISAEMLDTQASTVAQDQATLMADRAQIEQDKLQLAYTTIKAPIDGVAGFREVDVGNLVAPTDTKPLLTVVQMQPVAVLFQLPQGTIPEIQAGQAAAAHGGLIVEAWTQNGALKLASGTLETINNMVNDASGMITLKAIFNNLHSKLWPGEFVQARLIMKQSAHGLTVPAAAVQQSASGAFVWVVTPGRIAEIRPVKVGNTQFGVAQIASGLKAHELVVTDGQYGLKPGAPVAATASNGALKNVGSNQLGITP